MKQYEVLPATKEDVAFFYKELPYSIKAWVLFYKGERAALGGVIIRKFNYTVFFKLNEEVKTPKKIILKGILENLNKLSSLGVPISAIRDVSKINSAKLLMRCGFTFNRIENNNEVWLCQK